MLNWINFFPIKYEMKRKKKQVFLSDTAIVQVKRAGLDEKTGVARYRRLQEKDGAVTQFWRNTPAGGSASPLSSALGKAAFAGATSLRGARSRVVSQCQSDRGRRQRQYDGERALYPGVRACFATSALVPLVYPDEAPFCRGAPSRYTPGTHHLICVHTSQRALQCGGAKCASRHRCVIVYTVLCGDEEKQHFSVYKMWMWCWDRTCFENLCCNGLSMWYHVVLCGVMCGNVADCGKFVEFIWRWLEGCWKMWQVSISMWNELHIVPHSPHKVKQC